MPRMIGTAGEILRVPTSLVWKASFDHWNGIATCNTSAAWLGVDNQR